MADQRLAAACGLFCRACTLYIATTEDPARLEKLARGRGLSLEEVKCEGCRSGVVGPYCRQCKMVVCARDKGVEFCGRCDEYPCGELVEFQAAMPHRLELWNDLARIEEVGYDRWFEEKTAFYSCPDCGTVNSAYDLKCRSCGREPSCGFTEKHRSAIEAHLERDPSRRTD